MARTYETPKGTRDFLPEDMRLRSAVFERLIACFRLFGYDELDTPAFEYLEVLTLKAGPAAEKEIYAFDDKGGRRLGLRFDLTSSTGRVAASHPELKRPIYRYQIGKVWRYDRPAHGRYREFYQADADILGSPSMDNEVDLLLLASHVLRSFGLSDYQIILNNRKILEAQIRKAEIPKEKKPDALRALDKLDKIGRAEVINEAKGYGIEEGPFVAFLDLLGLKADGAPVDNRSYLETQKVALADDPQGTQGVSELSHIVEAAETLGFGQRLQISPTLARGLDYYTGPIFEAQARIGGTLMSFAGGGRYDDLIGLYGGAPQGAVGFSFGVERLIDLMRERGVQAGLTRPPPVLVAPFGKDKDVAVTAKASHVAAALREAGIATRLLPMASSRGKHFQYAEAIDAETIVLIGEREASEGLYPLKRLKSRQESVLALADLVAALS